MKQTAGDIRDKHLLMCYLIHGVKIPEKYPPYIKDAMDEHASNELASYKAELKEEIDERIRGLDIRIKSYEGKGKDQTANRSKRKQLHSIKALLEDNPTEK